MKKIFVVTADGKVFVVTAGICFYVWPTETYVVIIDVIKYLMLTNDTKSGHVKRHICRHEIESERDVPLRV